MTKSRLDALLLPLLGSILFIMLGALMEHSGPLGQEDFKGLYYGARCALRNLDPYRPNQPLLEYRAEGGKFPSSPRLDDALRQVVANYVNVPTTVLLVALVAALPWQAAVVVWMILTGAAFLLASLLVWNAASATAPWLSGGLLCLLIVNSELLLYSGNLAGIAVSLSVIAACCFLQNRFVLAGVLCLAIALAMKPQDAGLIWLYFLLAGAAQRKRALAGLAVTAAIALAAVLWISHIAPHWWPELEANVSASFSGHGLNNPGRENLSARGFGMMNSLQPMFALISDSPRFFNLASCAVCAVPLLLWCLKTVRAPHSQRSAWFALASISALGMLPVYHRTYDAKLLLLAIPACASLWKQGGAPRWIALALTAAAILANGDLFWIVVFNYTGFSLRSLNIGISIVPLVLLAVGIFYLYVYLRPTQAQDEPGLAPQLVAAQPSSTPA